jgi:FixJ family two-component response regulator
MTDKLFIYLVSNDEPFIASHKVRLGSTADLNVYRSAAELRSGLAARRPDLVILDTDVDGGQGFALHRELRDDFDTSDLYQLLLCDVTDVAREGFDADEQLIKPISDAILWRKLQQVGKVFAQAAASREQMAYAQNVAFTSMSSMGELGVVMQFLSKSFTCNTIQAVVALAVESLLQYELEGAVYVLWDGDSLIRTHDGAEISAHNRTLIEQRRTLGRLLEIDRNLVVNYDHVTILVTNLPEDDSQRLGRIRDNIATLTEGIESRIHGLLLEHDNILKQQGIRYAAWEIRDSVKNLDARQQSDLTHTRELVNHVIDDFENTFLHMGMQPEIENQLIGELVELRRKVSEIIAQPGEVHVKLQTVIAALETMAGKVSAPQ